MTTWTYRWRYPIRTDAAERSPGRLLNEARRAAIRDAADDGWRPASLPRFTLLDGPGDWSCAQITFEAVPLEAVELPEPGECVDCGERPGWGPGARRCRPCFAERAAYEPEKVPEPGTVEYRRRRDAKRQAAYRARLAREGTDAAR